VGVSFSLFKNKNAESHQTLYCSLISAHFADYNFQNEDKKNLFLLDFRDKEKTNRTGKETKKDCIRLKTMLQEPIFLAACNTPMTNKKPFKLQKGVSQFATFFATCNAYNKKDGGFT